MGDTINERNGSKKQYKCVFMSRSLELSDTISGA
jgi:hypothetical protein